MENEKIGQKMGMFISELRKSKQMTQKDLAAKLNITDKAVSKWERGLSCPDISLLSSIAEVLGVTTGELLNGERSSGDLEETEVSIDTALQYADKTVKSRLQSLHSIGAAAFSILLLTGVVVCAICDMAIAGAFTWSLFPISSIVFTWLVFFSVIRFGEKGVFGSLAALSVFTIPFLYVLDILVGDNILILPVGIRMAIISIVFLWGVFVLFQRWRTRKLLAAGISVLLAIPVSLLINYSLSGLIGEPVMDIWDLLSFFILAAIAIVLFAMNFALQKRSI